MCVLWHVIVGLASQRLDNASSLKAFVEDEEASSEEEGTTNREDSRNFATAVELNDLNTMEMATSETKPLTQTP